jgi:hypothetical protein
VSPLNSEKVARFSFPISIWLILGQVCIARELFVIFGYFVVVSSCTVSYHHHVHVTLVGCSV